MRHSHALSGGRSLQRETLEYRALFAVTFIVFLVAAIVESLVPRRWRRQSEANGEKRSIIQRASIGARTCVAYAFMG